MAPVAPVAPVCYPPLQMALFLVLSSFQKGRVPIAPRLVVGVRQPVPPLPPLPLRRLRLGFAAQAQHGRTRDWGDVRCCLGRHDPAMGLAEHDADRPFAAAQPHRARYQALAGAYPQHVRCDR
jgi:hypothetical protein